MLTPQYMANALVRSSSNIVKQEPIKSQKWRIWECLSNIKRLGRKNPSTRSRTDDIPISSPDALPLSYRRLVGGKATKLWVYVTNQWRIQTFRWGGGGGGGPGGGGGGGVGGRLGADAGCVSRFLFLKFGIWRAREKPCPVVRDN